MDRRRQKTRKAVFAAFEELVSKKRYAQITVQDIIDRADIGRSTFYAHFETKDSVLDAICTDLFSHIFDENPGREADHDFSHSPNTLTERLTHILFHLKEDQKRFGRLFSGESAELFWEYFRRWFERELGSAIREKLKTKKDLRSRETVYGPVFRHLHRDREVVVRGRMPGYAGDGRTVF